MILRNRLSEGRAKDLIAHHAIFLLFSNNRLEFSVLYLNILIAYSNPYHKNIELLSERGAMANFRIMDQCGSKSPMIYVNSMIWKGK